MNDSNRDLKVDGQEVPLKYDVSSLPMEVEGKEVPEDEDAKEQKNAVYLASGPAGDPRFERFVPYEGCLSNVEVIFPGYSIDIIQEFLEMKNGEPLEGMKESACGSPPSRRGNGHQEPNSRSGDVHLSLQVWDVRRERGKVG
ncbi:unnamed protein product [Darwinula stevensoni]|uniref:Uncharacterized protein n=1 Tax=Darwinula stevensoni TaxID=69355 RepID=A0A7R9AJB3_9CRUS|nr:unnamed protein product [Darwinula stevensoni]CAG0907066.1 unnamed protein product [Darwinula stevensoni]